MTLIPISTKMSSLVIIDAVTDSDTEAEVYTLYLAGVLKKLQCLFGFKTAKLFLCPHMRTLKGSLRMSTLL
jgi:hypothetical protein